MIYPIGISDLVQLAGPVPVADVRTPAEFVQGHIPGAFNIPLFTNEERAEVGTTYKQVGREAAILLGFDRVGNKWSGFIRQALEIAPQKKIALHCWRGGMRSGAMAWALNLYGFDVYLLEGGYKSYRKDVHRQFESTYQFWVLGGMTGSGKTNILRQLGTMGEQAIDLEELVQHRGSSYGSMNRLVQPTQEQFENNLAEQLRHMDRQRRIWIEDESNSIGKRIIPKPFWNQMCEALMINIQVPQEQRIQALVEEYGQLDKEFLIACTERIKKRMGFEQTKNAIAAISNDRMRDFITLIVMYYDKTYRAGLLRRKAGQVFAIEVNSTDPLHNAQLILKHIGTMPVADTVQFNNYGNDGH